MAPCPSFKRAGLEPWPRLFHNLRASRETALAAVHPLHVVTAWLGNTPKIAMQHYLQVVDADFEKAVNETCVGSGAKSGAEAVHNAAQHTRAPYRTVTQETNEALEELRAYAVVPTTYVDMQVVRATQISNIQTETRFVSRLHNPDRGLEISTGRL